MSVTTIIDHRNTLGDSVVIGPFNDPHRVFQASVDGVGVLSATIQFYASLDFVHWLLFGTVTLSGSNAVSDGFISNADWTYVKSVITSISGTEAAVTVCMGTSI